MIYLLIQGGCGNQFFQYAFARSIQEQTGQELTICWDSVFKSSHLFNGGEDCLQYFQTKYSTDAGKLKRKPAWILLTVINKIYSCIRKYRKYEMYDSRDYVYQTKAAGILSYFGIIFFGASYRPLRIPKTKDIVISGYFESDKYFKAIETEIKEELRVKKEFPVLNKRMYTEICKSNSVCVSIKRRDIKNNAYAYDISYFYHALSYIKARCADMVVFCFSDDIEWCRNNFFWDGEIYFESGKDPIYEKIRLMSACRHFVIHNSTFSWWAQYLSDCSDKIVIAPSKWMDVPWPIDIYCGGWIYLTPDGRFLNDHE